MIKLVSGLTILVLVGLLVAGCPPSNQPPAISSLTASEEQVSPSGSCQVECAASDPDGDELSYTWSASGGDISGESSTVTWTAPTAAGDYTIMVKVTDGKGGEATAELTIVVAVNHPPVIDSLTAEPQVVERTMTSTVECTASDPDGDELSYTWSASGGDISGEGSTVTWTAPETSGDYTIMVKVTDGKGGEATAELTIVVTVNHPPVITSLTAEPQEVLRSQTSTIECIAQDPDGDELSYTWLPSRGSISGEGSTVTWTAPNAYDTYTITVTVTDGRGGEATQSIDIEVTCGCGG
jgi:predicted secreted protein